MLTMSQQALRAVAVQHPAASGAIRLCAATGDLIINAASLAGHKARRLIPVLDHHGRWVALLRLEQHQEGLRIRTEVLGHDRRPRPGGWVAAAEDASIELSWEIAEDGGCRYLAMNAV